MLGKLLKFEMKASARTLLPIYAGTLLLALVCGISQAIQIRNNAEVQGAFASGTNIFFRGSTHGALDTWIAFCAILVFAFCVAVTVLTIITVVQRFAKGIAGNEGYLMLTLPVSHSKVLASKLLGALLWIIIGTIVIFLVGIIIGGSVLLAEHVYLDLSPYWNLIMEWKVILTALLALLNAIASLVSIVLTLYLAIMIGQMEQFSKYRMVVAMAAFFIISWAFGLAEDINMIGLANIALRLEIDTFARWGWGYMLISLMWNIISAAVCFLGTTWMMKKKLNL